MQKKFVSLTHFERDSNVDKIHPLYFEHDKLISDVEGRLFSRKYGKTNRYRLNFPYVFRIRQVSHWKDTIFVCVRF